MFGCVRDDYVNISIVYLCYICIELDMDDIGIYV